MSLPKLFTARALAVEVLTGGEVVPVWAGADPPIIPLPYPCERAGLIVPEAFGEWSDVCRGYRAQLDAAGVPAVAAELSGISQRHGGLPLALVGYEILEKGHRAHRAVFSLWWQDRTGEPVHELTDDGRKLGLRELHKQARPRRPRVRRNDKRLRGPWPGGLSWPLSDEEVEAWLAARHWQFARTMPRNPHHYTVRAWNPEEEFELVVLHVRERGYQQVYGGYEYTCYDAGEHFFWTMGADLRSTVVLNRKRVGQDEGERTAGKAEDRAGQPTLTDGEEEKA